MFLSELNEPNLLVVYCGRFQPFHKGHHAVYEYLTGKFGVNNVYIATSNKVDPPRSPFSFSEKSYFMQLTGVPGHRVIQVSNNYNVIEVAKALNMDDQSMANTVLIFPVSEKDMAEEPRFKSWTKKDGSPGALQPLENIKDTKSMKEFAYIMTVPTFDFKVMGQPMRSGTELRQQYIDSDEKTRGTIVADLFGKYTREAEQLMTKALAPAAPIAPPTAIPKLPKPAKAAGGVVKGIKEGGLDHSWAVKDEKTGEMGIRPAGGMGTWTEPTLISSLLRDLATVEAKITAKNATDAEYILYQKYSTVKAKLQALAKYEQFVLRNGKRAIKPGREIDLGEDK